MGYKTIVVHFERESDVRGSLFDSAAALANTHGAHLIGLTVLPSYYKVDPGAADAGIPMDAVREAVHTTALRMKAAFEERLRRITITGEWRIIDPGFRDTEQAVAEVANAACLIMACQDLHGSHDEGYRDGQGLLTVLTGRPVLLLPSRHAVEMPPERIVVAWDTSRPAARALFDALPLLHPPAQVTLLAVRQTDSFDGPEFLSRTAQFDDVEEMLSRHGISCKLAVEIARDKDIGREILAYTTKHQCGLLVLGGYGHSRLREWIFGGVTRTVLRESTIPLLLSH